MKWYELWLEGYDTPAAKIATAETINDLGPKLKEWEDSLGNGYKAPVDMLTILKVQTQVVRDTLMAQLIRQIADGSDR